MIEDGYYLVKIRRDWKVKPTAEQLDRNVYYFTCGWTIEESDDRRFAGEFAMIPFDESYPKDAPKWLASGDLVKSRGSSKQITEWRILGNNEDAEKVHQELMEKYKI